MTSHHFTIEAAPVPQPRHKVSTQGGFARAYYDRAHPMQQDRHRSEFDLGDPRCPCLSCRAVRRDRGGAA